MRVLITYFITNILCMVHTYSVATLNFNGNTSSTKIKMLQKFLQYNDIDVLFLQEVQTENFSALFNYTAYVNIGTDNLGTAIITKSGISLDSIEKLPSGRGISGVYQNQAFINIYAPSGSNKRRERNAFFQTEVPYLFRNLSHYYVFGGDFNCVLQPSDCTGNYNTSSTLKEFISTLQMRDVWLAKKKTNQYTFFSSNSAARLDRLYVPQVLTSNLQSVEVIPVPFSDHAAVVLHLKLDIAYIPYGKSYWKMNVSMLKDSCFIAELQNMWNNWTSHKTKYRDVADWWDSFVKPKIKMIFKQHSCIRYHDEERLLNFYFRCLADIQEHYKPSPEMRSKLSRYKANISTIYRQRMEGLKMRSRDSQHINNERVGLYHLIKEHKRRRSNMILQIEDSNNSILKRQQEISHCFHQYYTNLFSDHTEPTHNLGDFQLPIPPVNNVNTNILDQPISKSEVHSAILQGKHSKTPGCDGIPQEFYHCCWDFIGDDITEVFNIILKRNRLCASQKQGIITFIKKKGDKLSVDNYRPITLLNYDYKILARILVNRMKPILSEILHPAQKCGAIGRTIFDVTCSLRDCIAHCQQFNAKAILASLDFHRAFDSIQHPYLLQILQWHGFSDTFVRYLQLLFTDTTAVLQINGYLSTSIPIRRSIRQGCPASMALFTLAINPLLYKLQASITGISLLDYRLSTLAYADDVSVILTNDGDIQNLQDALLQFGYISGLTINRTKSKALLLGHWDEKPNLPLLQIVDNLTILGVTYYSNILQIQAANWDPVIRKVTFTARELYNRDLCLYQRVWALHSYVLSQLWFKSQVLVIPEKHARQITGVMLWSIWKGQIFKVPLSTLYRDLTAGGIGLFHVKLKCLSLFLGRNLKIEDEAKTFTSAWFQFWKTRIDLRSPPNLRPIPSTNIYLKTYLQESCYLDFSQMANKSFNRYIYERFINSLPQPVMRITRLVPQGVRLSKIWNNLNSSVIPVDVKSLWYNVIHDIISTKERLHRIHMIASEKCSFCTESDTIFHRLVQCSAMVPIQQQLNRYLQHLQSSTWFRSYHLLWPDFCIKPRAKHDAVLWVLAHTVVFSIKYYGLQNIDAYVIYMQYAKSKFLSYSHNSKKYSIYLSSI